MNFRFVFHFYICILKCTALPSSLSARHLAKKSIQKFHDIIVQEKISEYGFFKKIYGISEMQKNFLDYNATAFAKVYMPN